MPKKIKKLLLFILLISFSTLSSQEVSAPKFGKGLLNMVGKDSSWTMNFALRMQFLTTTNWDENEGNYHKPESNSLIRRSRLKFKGYAYNPNLTYNFQIGFSNKDLSGGSNYTNNSPLLIIDAFLKWKLYKNFSIQFGQAKLPGNIERIISSSKLALVDRSLLNSRFNIGRDFGLQIDHKFNLNSKFVLKETFAISQGEGRNVTKGNLGGHQYTGSIELIPFGDFINKGDYSGDDLEREVSPKLLFGIVYNFNNNAVKTRGNQGTYMETDYGLFEADVTTLFLNSHFKYKGLSIMAEYSNRNAHEIQARNQDNSLTGNLIQVGSAMNIQTGYLLTSNISITGRYTKINYEETVTSNNIFSQFTLGLSKYIVKHSLKIQTDISYEKYELSDDKIFYRLQFEIHF
jgi:phosphate-selective porin OprO/OprP